MSDVSTTIPSGGSGADFDAITDDGMIPLGDGEYGLRSSDIAVSANNEMLIPTVNDGVALTIDADDNTGVVGIKMQTASGSWYIMPPVLGDIFSPNDITSLAPTREGELATVTQLLEGDVESVAYGDTLRGPLRDPSVLLDSLIEGLTADDTTKKVFSTQTHTGTPAYVRNTSWYGYGVVDVTCVSPWNSTGGVIGGGIAVTPRHVICAWHNHTSIAVPGATIRFVTAANVIVDRVVDSIARVAVTDICVILLTADLPATIRPARLLPAEWHRFFNAEDAAIITFDQEEKALVQEVSYVDLDIIKWFTAPSDAQRLAFSEILITNDSGNPVLLFVGGETVFLGSVQLNDTAVSVSGNHRAGMLEVIETLGAFGYTPTCVTLDASAVQAAEEVIASPQVYTTVGYTVAGLAGISNPVAGMRAHVTDANAPTFLGALSGSGAVPCPAFYNGTIWVAG